jgi:glucokinase
MRSVATKERQCPIGVDTLVIARGLDLLQPTPPNASLVLIADIGGSTSRFALAVCGGRPQQVVVVSNATVATLEAAITQYPNACVRPAAAILPWPARSTATTSRSPTVLALCPRLSGGVVSSLRVINDFEALAWPCWVSMPLNAARWIRTKPDAGVKVVLGPHRP